jgi:eukaryotic-like serine/threonine-protein kinase
MDPEPLGHRYAVIRPIGAGAMTRVFEAWDRHERRPVALKVPVQRLADDRGFLGRLERQVAAVVGFTHPDVAAVHGIHRGGSGGGFVVAELVDGSSLREMLEARGPLPPFGAARVAVRVCAVLAAAHAQGLTHGHLTPTNVLLGIHGQVKLTDFRLAQAARPLAAVPDPDDDLRALGRLLVVMLTGREPAAGERVRLGPEVPPELAAIVARAAGGPQRGYRSAGDLGRDLSPFLAAGAPAAGQAGSPAAPQPPVGAVQRSGAAQPTRVAPVTSPEPPAGSRVAPSEPPAGRRVARSPARRHRGLRLVAALVGAGLFLVGAAVAVGLAGGEPREPAAGKALTPPSAAVVVTTTSRPAAGGVPATTAPATTAPPRTAPPATTRPAGPGPRTVPDVVGLHRGQATDVLREAQLDVQIVRLQVDDPGQVQRVVAQQPPAGQLVPAQSVVRLTIGTKRAGG